MSKQGLRWLTAIVVAILYVCIWQHTKMTGTERKNAAVRTVKIMTSTSMSVDSRLKYVFNLIEGDNAYTERILKIFALTQDDFELTESPVTIPGTVPYSVKIYDTAWTLSVNYNYFLENISMVHSELEYVAAYTMIPTDAVSKIPNAVIRQQLDLPTDEYVYQSDVFTLSDDTAVKIVVNIAKPYFYNVIYPNTLYDFMKLFGYIFTSFFLTYALLISVGTYRGNAKTTWVKKRTDPTTGLYNRVKLEEYYFKDGDVIILIRLLTDMPEQLFDTNVLKAFSNDLHRSSRVNDTLIKLYKGEFAIILPNATEGAVASIVSRLRKWSSVDFTSGSAVYRLGMSRAELLSEADDELTINDTKK